MTTNEPTIDQKRKITDLVDTIFLAGRAVLFLGAGASREGTRRGKPFPGYRTIQEEVLKDRGVNFTEADRDEVFINEMREMSTQPGYLSKFLNKYLSGTPGQAHYALAAAMIALYPYINLLLTITTNFDTLMEDALRKISDFEPGFRVKTVTNIFTGNDGNLRKLLQAVELWNNDPVIVHLFGDLNFEDPIFDQDDMEILPMVVRQYLRNWMSCPLIFIGYSFSDEEILKLLDSTERHKHPIYVVTPEKIDNLTKRSIRRKVSHIDCEFGKFINCVLHFLICNGENKPSLEPAIEKLGKLLSQICDDDLVQFLNPKIRFQTLDKLKIILYDSSSPSLARAEEKLPKANIVAGGRQVQIVERPDSAPVIHQFVQSDRPLMLITGESGCGKSTFLFGFATKKPIPEIITLFYDVHNLKQNMLLSGQLCSDFKCVEPQLPDVLKQIHKTLSKHKKKLIIILDGINESKIKNHSFFVSDIENLAKNLPASIKIIFSCRKIFWDIYIGSIYGIAKKYYFKSSECFINQFSDNELRAAFIDYQKTFKFIGDFDLLRPELKRKIKDPLMLRMISEGYCKEPLPEFAPAVLIFEKYEESLNRKFDGTFLVDFLTALAQKKIEESDSGSAETDQFTTEDFLYDRKLSRLTELQERNEVKRGKPHLLLEDEGILLSLDTRRTTYRFTYERFYEYLLGRELEKSLKFNAPGQFVRDLALKVRQYNKSHFSIIEGLRSEIIRFNIKKKDSALSFFSKITLEKAINYEDYVFVSFIKDILRELVYEVHDRNIIDIVRQLEIDPIERQLLILDIGGDSSGVLPELVNGILSGDHLLLKRCVQKLILNNKAPDYRKKFEDHLFGRIVNLEDFDIDAAVGIIYYSAAIFKIEEETDLDPVISVLNFWNHLLSITDLKRKTIVDIFSHAFIKVYNTEGPLFFSDEARWHGMDYIWTDMSYETKQMALELLPYFSNNKSLKKNKRIQKIILFFGSELKHWYMLDRPKENEIFVYKFEFLVAQWLLILRSQKCYTEVKEILTSYVKTGFWLSIDFALCTMKFMIGQIFQHNPEIQKDGFEAMKEWTVYFENSCSEYYAALEQKDPFNVNFIPIGPLASVETYYFTEEGNSIGCLEEYILSENIKKVKMAVLCTRYFWKQSPQKVLRTLKLVVDHENSKVRDWTQKVLREIYLVYPRLIEDFFIETRIDAKIQRHIKHRKDVTESTGFEYSEVPLLKALLQTNEERKQTTIMYYRRLLKSESLQEYTREILNSFYFLAKKKNK